MASSNKGEDPESVRKMVKMILSKDSFATEQAELLLLCGIALSDSELVKQACELGASPGATVSNTNLMIMNEFGYFKCA